MFLARRPYGRGNTLIAELGKRSSDAFTPAVFESKTNRGNVASSCVSSALICINTKLSWLLKEKSNIMCGKSSNRKTKKEKRKTRRECSGNILTDEMGRKIFEKEESL